MVKLIQTDVNNIQTDKLGTQENGFIEIGNTAW